MAVQFLLPGDVFQPDMYRFFAQVGRLGAGISPPMLAVDDQNRARLIDLVTASRILENEGVLDSYGHVSVRSATDPAHFFMPRALPPGSITAGDVVELDLDCNPIVPNPPRFNGERYIHSEIYKARPDVQCVIHSHSQAVIPFSVAGVPLPPVTPVFEIREATGPVEVRGMLVTTSALGAFLAKKLGDAPAILLRGHGDAVVGTSVKQAVVRAIYVSLNARVQAEALKLSPTITALDDAELAYNAKENFDVDRPWANFKRRLTEGYYARGRDLPEGFALEAVT
jgi:HCOMODA/2-hydroxy-3-carboxy-muconic semialdehyde decarboxylase